MKTLPTLLIIILVSYIFSLKSDITDLEQENRSLQVRYNHSVEQYDYLYDATSCFFDGETNWRDCVSDLENYR